MNWFVYCGNNPLSRTDPTGLDAGMTNWENDQERKAKNYDGYHGKEEEQAKKVVAKEALQKAFSNIVMSMDLLGQVDEWWGSNIGNEWTLSGCGIKQDLEITALYLGMNSTECVKILNGIRLIAAGSELKGLSVIKGNGIWQGDILSTYAATDMKMYRVWGGKAGQIESWLTPIKPVSAVTARSSLSLPLANTAQYFSEVTIPAGTRFQIGLAGAGFGQVGGGKIQIQLLESISASNFGPGVLLP